MRQFILILLLVALSHTGKAQVTLDKSYNHSCISTKINETDYKYYLMDTELKQCRIYNLDHSLFKTINLSIPNNMYLYDIRFVTQNLFDLDDKIELLYVYYEYIITSIANNTGYYKYYTKIINENGNVLLNSPGTLYSYMYLINDTDYRLFLYSYDYSITNYKIWTDIYKVPGTPYFLKAKGETTSAVLSDAYPNPSREIATIAYELPTGIFEAELNVYDMGGKKVAGYRVDRNFSDLQIPTGSLLPGNYLYYIEAQGARSEAKKLIVQY